MKIAVIGTGYVGLPSGAAFAEMGNTVICVDSDAGKIEKLKSGEMTIHEEGLAPMVQRGVEHNLLLFSTDLSDAINKSEIVFIAVGTPMGEDGSADLRYVEAVAREIGSKMEKSLIIVDKSTVPVGTAFRVRDIIKEELNKRSLDLEFDVISNPEFMAEGRAVRDMMEPSRVVVGTDNPRVMEKMKALYAPFTRKAERFVGVGVLDAELIKYAANTMLATRISFMNAIAGVCDLIGADVNNVRIGIGSDPRIGSSFLFPSCGYGGSCFPKDVQALIAFAKKKGLPDDLLSIFESVEKVNAFQKKVISNRVIEKFGSDLSGKKFAVWGLAFKADTDDMRESASITIINELVSRGAKVLAYDPLATKQAQNVYLRGIEVEYESHDKYTILGGCEALIIATETKEYRASDFERIKSLLKNPIIFDGRNLFNPSELKSLGFEYHGIGRGQNI